jgi:hypothetical protein
MTCAAPAHDRAIWLGENLNRFSSSEHYLGSKQKLRHAVNDNLGLEDV